MTRAGLEPRQEQLHGEKTRQSLTYLMTYFFEPRPRFFCGGGVWALDEPAPETPYPPPISLQGKWGDDGGGRFLFCIVAEKGRKLNRSAWGFLPRQRRAGGTAHIRRHPEVERSGRKTVFLFLTNSRFCPRLSCLFWFDPRRITNTSAGGKQSCPLTSPNLGPPHAQEGMVT